MDSSVGCAAWRVLQTLHWCLCCCCRVCGLWDLQTEHARVNLKLNLTPVAWKHLNNVLVWPPLQWKGKLIAIVVYKVCFPLITLPSKTAHQLENAGKTTLCSALQQFEVALLRIWARESTHRCVWWHSCHRTQINLTSSMLGLCVIASGIGTDPSQNTVNATHIFKSNRCVQSN